MLTIAKSEISANRRIRMAIRHALSCSCCCMKQPSINSINPTITKRNNSAMRNASRILNWYRQKSRAVFKAITPQLTPILKLEYPDSNNPKSTLTISAKPPSIRIILFMFLSVLRWNRWWCLLIEDACKLWYLRERKPCCHAGFPNKRICIDDTLLEHSRYGLCRLVC